MIIRSHHHCYSSEFTERAAKPHQVGGIAATYSYRLVLNNNNSYLVGRVNWSATTTAAIKGSSSRRRLISSITTSVVASCAVVLLASPPAVVAAERRKRQDGGEEEEETLGNVPQTLAGECEAEEGKDCKKAMRIQRPKSRKAETCTVKCVNTCIRGGDGEGPLNIRRPLVVFKQGFRSRHYCLVECSEICNLIGDGDDGP
ncbi:unnamed protein product [Linum tenue]|uniref:Uncharacterized protein n=1 Tax=Linum tenue TaxID=586396 RepID=A0AAV0M6R3_9ROSI|nr:unnamed protein product [Linum tenue]